MRTKYEKVKVNKKYIENLEIISETCGKLNFEIHTRPLRNKGKFSTI